MLAHFSQPPLVDPMLWLRMELPESQWQLHLLHDIVHSQTASHWAAVAAGGLWLAASLLVLYIRQRQRLAALRQRSRKELETVLHQHAQELRTAQDGIVQAAKQADTGLSRSLQHLPQGVVVVDPQLRLVAWNSRYVELFRYPPELMHVGQPIEALIRHNARRGLLGKGDVEPAIQRRLQHLRSGSPICTKAPRATARCWRFAATPARWRLCHQLCRHHQLQEHGARAAQSGRYAGKAHCRPHPRPGPGQAGGRARQPLQDPLCRLGRA
jgi:PAS domain-containing protein